MDEHGTDAILHASGSNEGVEEPKASQPERGHDHCPSPVTTEDASLTDQADSTRTELSCDGILVPARVWDRERPDATGGWPRGSTDGSTSNEDRPERQVTHSQGGTPCQGASTGDSVPTNAAGDLSNSGRCASTEDESNANRGSSSESDGTGNRAQCSSGTGKVEEVVEPSNSSTDVTMEDKTSDMSTGNDVQGNNLVQSHNTIVAKEVFLCHKCETLSTTNCECDDWYSRPIPREIFEQVFSKISWDSVVDDKGERTLIFYYIKDPELQCRLDFAGTYESSGRGTMPAGQWSVYTVDLPMPYELPEWLSRLKILKQEVRENFENEQERMLYEDELALYYINRPEQSVTVCRTFGKLGVGLECKSRRHDHYRLTMEAAVDVLGHLQWERRMNDDGEPSVTFSDSWTRSRPFWSQKMAQKGYKIAEGTGSLPDGLWKVCIAALPDEANIAEELANAQGEGKEFLTALEEWSFSVISSSPGSFHTAEEGSVCQGCRFLVGATCACLDRLEKAKRTFQRVTARLKSLKKDKVKMGGSFLPVTDSEEELTKYESEVGHRSAPGSLEAQKLENLRQLASSPTPDVQGEKEKEADVAESLELAKTYACPWCDTVSTGQVCGKCYIPPPTFRPTEEGDSDVSLSPIKGVSSMDIGLGRMVSSSPMKPRECFDCGGPAGLTFYPRGDLTGVCECGCHIRVEEWPEVCPTCNRPGGAIKATGGLMVKCSHFCHQPIQLVRHLINCPICGEAVGPRPSNKPDKWDCYHQCHGIASTPLVRTSTTGEDPSAAGHRPALKRTVSFMSIRHSQYEEMLESAMKEADPAKYANLQLELARLNQMIATKAATRLNVASEAEKSDSVKVAQPCLEVSNVEPTVATELPPIPEVDPNPTQKSDQGSQTEGDQAEQLTGAVPAWARCCIPNCGCSKLQAHDD